MAEQPRHRPLVSRLAPYLDALLDGSTADACYVYLDEAGATKLRVARGDVALSAGHLLPEELEAALETGEPSFAVEPVTASMQSVRAQAVLPIDFRTSRLGVLCVEYHMDHLFTEEDKWFFKVLVHQLGQSLHFFQDNQVLLEQLTQLKDFSLKSDAIRLFFQTFEGRLTQRKRAHNHA